MYTNKFFDIIMIKITEEEL